MKETSTAAASHGDAAWLLPVLRLAPLRPQAQLDPPRSPAILGARPATPRSTTAGQLGEFERTSVVQTTVSSHTASSGMKRRFFAKVIWGAQCGKSARWVLLGETSSRSQARSVRALARKCQITARLRKGLQPQGSSLPSSGYDFRKGQALKSATGSLSRAAVFAQVATELWISTSLERSTEKCCVYQL